MSATTGTADAGLRPDRTPYLRGATALAEGLSSRATGRLLGVDPDTAHHWLPGRGQPCPRVMNDCFRDLHLHECHLDELWTFIHQQEDHLTSLEQRAEVSGEAWGWRAFSPVCQLVPAWVVGKRTLLQARRLLFRLKSAPDGPLPFLTRDALPHDADALLAV